MAEDLGASASNKTCLVCGSSKKLLRCAECQQAYYCSKDHQIQHWKYHKYVCKKTISDYFSSSTSVTVTSTSANNASARKPQIAQSAQTLPHFEFEELPECQHLNCKVKECNMKSEEHPVACDPLDLNSDHDVLNEYRTSENHDRSQIANIKLSYPLQEATSSKGYSVTWLNSICDILVKDMNSHGICVIDNFLGCAAGDGCLQEVCQLYGTGVFKAGKLIKRIDQPSENIRSDFITWINGTEANCENISILIKILDAVIKKVNKQPNSGQLKNYELSKRTKAMISCYPGSGTHYVKHVDNPNDDGRCLTCIYYLNKCWNASKDGGLLRVFPSHENTVANIEPKFDRIIFFWSDRRNPHEVQPAFRTRFAITVWYVDSKYWKSGNNEINSNETSFTAQCT